MEGGLFEVDGTWFEAGWVVVVSAGGSECAAPSVGFGVPSRLLPHLLSGRDLNEAVEAVLGISAIGEGDGIMGFLPRGVVARSRAYEDAVVMALARLRRPELW